MSKNSKPSAKPDIKTGGGAYIGGSVSINGASKFVGRDDNSSAGLAAEQIAQLFESIYKQIDQKANLEPDEKQDVKADVQDVQKQVAKGEEADESFLERRLRNIKRMAPDILDVITSTLADPALGVAKVIQKVMAKAKATT